MVTAGQHLRTNLNRKHNLNRATLLLQAVPVVWLKPWHPLFILTSNPISKLRLYGIRVLFPVKNKNHRTYKGVRCRENEFLTTVATGSTIKIKLAQLALHAPPAIIKDCKQMPKRLHFLFWGTYGAVFDMNFLCPVEGMLYSRALNPSLRWSHQHAEVMQGAEVFISPPRGCTNLPAALLARKQFRNVKCLLADANLSMNIKEKC